MAGKLVLAFSWEFGQCCGPWFLSKECLGLLRAWWPGFKSKHPMRTKWKLYCLFGLRLGNNIASLLPDSKGWKPDPTSQWAKFQSHIGKKWNRRYYYRYFWKILSVPIFIIMLEINLRPRDKKKYIPFAKSNKKRNFLDFNLLVFVLIYQVFSINIVERGMCFRVQHCILNPLMTR